MMKRLDDADFLFTYKMEHIGETPFIMKLHIEIEGSAFDYKNNKIIYDKAGYADLIVLNMRNAMLTGENMREAIDETSINYNEYCNS